MEGVCQLPDSLQATVPVEALSHSAKLTAYEIGSGSTTFTTTNGILYSKDKATLFACPSSIGDSVVLDESTTTIGAHSFAGATLKSLVVQGSITFIDPTAFNTDTKQNATIVLSTSASNKQVWLDAGFTHFKEPAKPGDTNKPTEDQSGFTYTVLDDMTLLVAWQGTASPDQDLIIPASAELNGVSYRVSSIAQNAFENTPIQTLTIPASVTTINDSAFKGCTNLTRVSLTEGLTTIGTSAFENTGLTKIILPKSTTSIADRAFAANAALTQIVALGSIPSVADTAIVDCSNVSVLYPFDRDIPCAWSPGLPALANHVEAYGFDLPRDSLVLEVGTSTSMFDGGEVYLPEGTELSYSYPSRSLSVDQDGVVKAIGVGSDSVVATISLDGQELARTTKTVVATPKTETVDEGQSTLGSDSLTSSADPAELESPTPMPFASLSLLGATGTVGSTFEYTYKEKTLTYKILSLSSDGKMGTVQMGTGSAPTVRPAGDVEIPGIFTSGDGILFTVTEIGAYVFSGSNVTSVRVPDTVTAVGVSAFTNTRSLETTNIPASVTFIDQEAYTVTGALKNLNVDPKNEWFVLGEDGVLYGRESANGTINHIHVGLKSKIRGEYSVPNTVASIGNRAFWECSGMTAISIPLSVKRIGYYAFYSTEISSLRIPESVEVMGGSIVRNCIRLTELTIAEANRNYAIYQGTIVGIENGVPVSMLGGGPSTVKGHLEIPGTVKKIEYAAFDGCFNMMSVTIPAQVSTDGLVFNSCRGLTDIACYSKSFNPVGNFNGIPAATLASITVFLPSGTDRTKWQTAGFTKFADAPPITASFDVAGGTDTTLQLLAPDEKVVRPADPTKPGCLFGGWWDSSTYTNQWNFDTPVSADVTLYARWYAAGETFEQDGFRFTLAQDAQSYSVSPLATNPLGAVVLPGIYTALGAKSLAVTHIDEAAFKDKAALTSVAIPDSIQTMGEGVFQNCTSLTSVTFDAANQIAAIPAFAFAGCTKLPSVALPTTVTTLGEGAFQECSSLASLPAGGSVASIGKSAFAACTGLTEVNLPDSVTSLGGYAFTGCTNLSRLRLGTGLTTIQDQTFFNCEAITYIESRGSVTSIATDSSSLDSAFMTSVKTKAVVALDVPASANTWTTAGFLRVGSNTEHTYSFDVNGGSPDVPGGTLSPGTYVPAPTLTPTKKGYSFANWKDLATNTTWSFTSDLMPATDLTLSAQWIANTYTIKFNPNTPRGASHDGYTDDLAMTFDVAKPLPASGYTCKDYVFQGWNTNKDGSGTHYNAKDSVSNLTDIKDGVVVLYAQWKGAEYSVHFDANTPAGSTLVGNMTDQTMVFGQWATLKPNTYQISGFIFRGWNTKQDGTGVPCGDSDWVQNVAQPGTTSVTLYAMWDEAYKVDVPLNPTISIDAQGTVTSDATTKFINKGVDTINVVALEVTALTGAQDIFSNPGDVELVMTDVADKKLKASVFLATGSKGYCNIPLIASTERFMSFTLNLPEEGFLTYRETPVSVASVAYTFSLA